MVSILPYFHDAPVSLFPVSYLPLVKFELDQSPVLLLPTLHSLDVYDMRNTSSCSLHSDILLVEDNP